MPGRLICFVCGSPGAESTLRIRQQDGEPYFPFLIHHEPPKGARLPTPDSIVDSCRVCYMFLTQQWDSYERTKTPAVKRLYWLKRADNGNFTGAEMRIQGEYIAQVMGLQYPPGFEDGGSPESSNLPPEREFSSQNNTSSSMFSYQSSEKQHHKSHDELTPKSSVKDSALDLSTPKKASEKKKKQFHDGDDVKPSDDAKSVCYICGQLHVCFNSNYVNVLQQAKNEPYFPILEKISPPPGSEFMTRSGQVKVCNQCKNVLYQQWQAYEMSGTPMSMRNFKIPSEFLSQRHLEHGQSFVKTEDTNLDKESSFYCYICGNSYISDHVRLLNTLPPKRSSPTTMFYPFVRELKRPPCAEPLRSDGSVIVCIKCYGHLSYQWEIQEAKGVPLYHRQYSLQFLSNKNSVPAEQVPASSPVSSPREEQILPLNIQISSASPMQSNQNSGTNFATTAQGLLAIASAQAESEFSRPGSRNSSMSSCSPVKSYNISFDSKIHFMTERISKTVPHPLQTVNEMPKKVCFLCAEKCIIHKMKFLCSYPARHEAKHTNTQIEPFFPFLANINPPPGAEPLTEDGTVIVCKMCYYSLLKQWSEYEHSLSPADSNRWLRKYSIPEYVCYVCSSSGIERGFMRSIVVDKFLFLREHKVPKGALVIDDGQRVAVCKSCAYSLMQQFAEFERIGLPPQLRKYNWMHKSVPSVLATTTEEESQDGISRHMSVGDVNDPEQHTENQKKGGPPGLKPPPLNMLSPAGSKVQRNTATVSPLHHVTSPTNGVNSVGGNAALNASRTSSFAAALRKLANQAKDPPDEGIVKTSKSASPRDTVPKSGPPPLVYTSTTLTSPPVVTIAPTQSHPSLLASDTRPVRHTFLCRLHSMADT